jgi:hypothetical protein
MAAFGIISYSFQGVSLVLPMKQSIPNTK